jgi:hypothetical protein
MTANFGGTCNRCSGNIRKGDQINWIAKGVIEHGVCPLIPEAPVVRPLYSFARVPGSDEFVVRVRDGAATDLTGNVVSVPKSKGGYRTVTLGEVFEATSDLVFYAISADGAMASGIEPGVYELEDGTIYVVKPTKDKQRLYAKRLIEIGSTRLNAEDEVVQIDFEYERGAISKIRPDHKMPFERAKALTIRYGRCIVCGRRLKVAESVERGIGPKCAKNFRVGV